MPALTTQQSAMLSTITMQVQARGWSVGLDDSDRSLYSAIKRDIAEAQGQRNPGPHAHKALAHHLELVSTQMASIDSALSDTPPRAQKKLRERRDDLALVAKKLEVALESFVEFAPKEDAEETPAAEEKAKPADEKPAAGKTKAKPADAKPADAKPPVGDTAKPAEEKAKPATGADDVLNRVWEDDV